MAPWLAGVAAVESKPVGSGAQSWSSGSRRLCDFELFVRLGLWPWGVGTGGLVVCFSGGRENVTAVSRQSRTQAGLPFSRWVTLCRLREP